MTTFAEPRRAWIRSPAVDLLFFGYGWVALCLPLLWALEQRSSWTGAIVLLVLMVNYLHRHYTFALVYGEHEEFEKRKTLYVWLPVAAVAVTVGFVSTGNFALLLTLSVLWTIYHSVGQKYGITRIYARKAGYGEAWIEKGLIFSWFYYLVLAIAEKEAPTLELFDAGRVLLRYVGPAMPYLTGLSLAALAIAVVFTALFIRQEYLNRHRISAAKILYVLSVMVLYTLFFHSLVFGYIVFAFSHALEYIALVNIFVGVKYRARPAARSLLARAARRLWPASILFSVVILAACLAARGWNEQAFGVYIVGSSFLHFIYDGLIWKVRRPEVGKPFGVSYSTA
jgi:hypothetical protein